MENRSLITTFFKYSSLSIIGTLGVSCYILADIFFVSRGLGTDGLAAMNLAIPIYNFIHGSGMMLGMGGATKFTICKKANDSQNADVVYTSAFYLALIISCAFMVVGQLFSKPLVILLGADKNILPIANTYLKWLLLFSPAFILNDLFLCFVRNDDSPQLSSAAMLIGSFSNIILDYIFIFPLDMGIFGAILATGVSPVISMGIMASHRLKRKNSFHLQRGGIQKKYGKEIFSLGFPSLIMQMASGISMITFNFLILRLTGNVGVAAYGVIANISLVVTAIFNGISHGIQPIISSSWGENKIRPIRQIFTYAITSVLVFSIILYLCLTAFSNPIVSAFNSECNQQMQEIAVYGLNLYFLSLPFVGCNIMISVLFTSTEFAFPAHVLSILRGVVLIVPVACLLSAWGGMTGIWFAYPVTELIAFAGGLPICIRYLNKMMKKEGADYGNFGE